MQRPSFTHSIVPALASVFMLTTLAPSAGAVDTRSALTAAVNNDARTPANKERDKYRHPLETLSFFGVQPDQTVIEIWPSAGWYTEILAPYLKDKGHYIAALGGPEEGIKKFNAEFANKPQQFGTFTTTTLDPKKVAALAPDNSVDTIVTFRNVHNWMKAGTAPQVFAAFFKALKPGGHLGVEEHRASADKPQDPKAESGYVREYYVINMAKKAGFTVVAKADINANPKDTKDYPKGVWTLPPVLRNGDVDKDKYLAIGESDRMTLLFVKK